MSDPTAVILSLLFAAVVLYVLFHVIRAAVLSALRQHDREVSEREPAQHEAERDRTN